MRMRGRLISVMLVLTVLGGCKEVLYSSLAEGEANEMVALLAASGIHSVRGRDKKGIYTLSVEAADIPASVMLLKAANLPSEKFLDFGDVFNSEGIVSTPFEQQALYIHALNQELSRTLTGLRDIRTARVLITSPPQGRYDRAPPRATASVTLEHEPTAKLTDRVGIIKSIVANAVPNLDYDDVVVALFQADGPTIRPLANVGAVRTVQASLATLPLGSGIGWRQIMLVMGGISFMAILALLFYKPAARSSGPRS